MEIFLDVKVAQKRMHYCEQGWANYWQMHFGLITNGEGSALSRQVPLEGVLIKVAV